MKIRSDFVTNSSSSSFVCEICGRAESGWDYSPGDVEMYVCENGHTFCFDEALEKPTRSDMIKMILENKWNHKTEEELSNNSEDELFDYLVYHCSDDCCVPECMCPICQFIEYSEYDLSKYLLMEYGIPREEVFAEVKALNKRRKKLYENEYITYVCKRFDLNPTEIVAGWKERFGTYREFKNWLNDKEE